MEHPAHFNNGARFLLTFPVCYSRTTLLKKNPSAVVKHVGTELHNEKSYQVTVSERNMSCCDTENLY